MIGIKQTGTWIIFLLFSITLQAQMNTDLLMSSSFWSGKTTYSKEGHKLKKSAVKNLLSVNEDALKLFNSGSSQQSGANVLGFIGGGLIGWPLGGAIAGSDDPMWFLAGIGAGALTIGAVLHSGGTKKLRSAVDIYNNEALGELLVPKNDFSIF